MTERPTRARLRRLLLVGGIVAAAAYVLVSEERRASAASALRRAWQLLRPPTVEAPAPPVAAEAEPAPVRSEPRPETVVVATEPAPHLTRHELDGVGVLLRKPEDLEPEALEPESAGTVEAEEQSRAPEIVSSGRRRWAAAASVAALLCGAGALAAVSWAVWDPDDGNGESQEATPSAPGAAVLAAVSRPTAKRIPVAGSKGKVVLVVAPDGRAALIVSGLSRAPRGRQFEAWVIVGSTPKRAGLFSGGPGYVVVPLTRAVPKGATVAVTLERTGGVDAPTTTPLFATKRA